jgi:hypothetical protein
MPFYPDRKEPNFNHVMCDMIPSINERLSQFYYKKPDMWKFDDEIDKAKWHWGNEDAGMMSMEEKLSKYASEFREKADKTAKLLKMARNE